MIGSTGAETSVSGSTGSAGGRLGAFGIRLVLPRRDGPVKRGTPYHRPGTQSPGRTGSPSPDRAAANGARELLGSS
jgi:hypothetical protein